MEPSCTLLQMRVFLCRLVRVRCCVVTEVVARVIGPRRTHLIETPVRVLFVSTLMDNANTIRYQV
jgi:hypothetical protein